jgi:hypothetical protein
VSREISAFITFLLGINFLAPNMAVSNPADDVLKFIEKARDIKEQLVSNMSNTLGRSYTEDYIESLDELNRNVSDPAKFIFETYRFDDIKTDLDLGDVQEKVDAIEVSMENAEALANSAGEGTLEIAELRCSQTVPEVWQEALAAEAGNDVFDQWQSAHEDVCKVILVIADFEQKLQHYNEIAEEGYPLFYKHKKDKKTFAGVYKRTLQYWADVRVEFPETNELLQGDISGLQLKHEIKYKYSSKNASEFNILKMLISQGGQKDGICFPLFEIPGAKAYLCAKVESASSSMIKLHTKAMFKAYGEKHSAAIGTVSIPAPFGYLADLQDIKNSKVMDMKSALIERVADTLPHQGKALAAMEQMAN